MRIRSFDTGLAILGTLLLACALGGCTTVPVSGSPLTAAARSPGGFALAPAASFYTLSPSMSEADEEDEESSVWGTVILYLPNRILDLCEMVRAGVNVGPGLGLDFRATKWAKLQLISDTSVGVGFQGLRHLPVCARSQMKIGLGFISSPGMDILNWYYGDYDLRLELHLLLIGAHAAVDFGEIIDFIGGIFTWDPMEDDFRVD